jgi:hypothetical protein
LLLSFEGSDEDTAERAGIVPDSAAERFLVWDRWARGDEPAVPLPRAADSNSIELLAQRIRDHEIDVLGIDTGSKFFAGAHDVSKGIPEEAFGIIDRIHALARRPLAVVVVAHTRKLANSSTRARDELEEVAGTFGKNADAVVVIRREGDDRGPRRRVVFAKSRRGPEPADVIASFPGRDEPGPPLLSVVAHAGGPAIKEGTEAEEIAEWIRQQPAPVSNATLRARFDLSDSTLNRRRPLLEDLGIRHGKLQGRGNAHGYGTNEQWVALLGVSFGLEETS